MMRSLLLFLLILPGLLSAQKFEKLALTPPMGWNSWNTFHCDIDEQLIRGVADAMVSSGMKDAGYTYVVIDNCWHGQRDSLGFIHPDPVKFPSGMKALADYVHSKGLKFGIYSDAGHKTCGGFPGSRGHEYQDAVTYAQWGVDYLKYDWCNTDSLNAFWAYSTMRDALFAAGRPILFSLCEWGNNSPWLWAKDVGHMWRTSGDIAPCFDCEVDHGTWSSWGAMRIVHMRGDLREYAGPDHWNDYDMMEVGNGMSVQEDRSHFSMWCMLTTPLIAGNDIRNMSAVTKSILTNPEAIAINQDSLGIQAFMYDMRDSVEIWIKPLAKGDWAFCFLNRGNKVTQFTFDWQREKIYDNFSKRKVDFTREEFKVWDVWTRRMPTNTKQVLRIQLLPHDVTMLRLRKL